MTGIQPLSEQIIGHKEAAIPEAQDAEPPAVPPAAPPAEADPPGEPAGSQQCHQQEAPAPNTQDDDRVHAMGRELRADLVLTQTARQINLDITVTSATGRQAMQRNQAAIQNGLAASLKEPLPTAHGDTSCHGNPQPTGR